MFSFGRFINTQNIMMLIVLTLFGKIYALTRNTCYLWIYKQKLITHTHYQQSYPLIIRTTNQPLGDQKMSSNNEFPFTHIYK